MIDTSLLIFIQENFTSGSVLKFQKYLRLTSMAFVSGLMCSSDPVNLGIIVRRWLRVLTNKNLKKLMHPSRELTTNLSVVDPKTTFVPLLVCTRVRSLNKVQNSCRWRNLEGQGHADSSNNLVSDRAVKNVLCFLTMTATTILGCKYHNNRPNR